MIYLITATIRPKEFLKTETFWRKQSSKKNTIATKVIVDKETDKEIICDKSTKNDITCYVYGLNAGGITKPLSHLTNILLPTIADEDIIVVMSDDFYPPKKWDTYLVDFYKSNKGCLSVKVKGLQDGGRDSIVSLPIMDGYTLKRLNGYIYHPSYNHLYSDNELYDNVKFLNLLHVENDLNAPFFEHKHWTTSGRIRDKHDEVTHSTALKDKQVYEHRKKLSFYERTKIRPVLSILICSLHERSSQLQQLFKVLDSQIKNKSVEVKACVDSGELNIPQKRNRLLNSSMGEYVCFIDDDDLVSDDYIDQILQKIIKFPDCVGIRGCYFYNGVYKKDFIHSIQFSEWGENKQFYERSPNHLNPIKREHILKIGGFDESLKSGEDVDFSKRIYPHLKSEALIEKPIYQYLFINTNKKY